MFDDAPALETACPEPAITDFTSVPTAYSVDAARAWVARQHDKRIRGEVCSLAIEIPGQQLPVGNVSLDWVGRDDGLPEAGYWLIPGARGDGIASLAVSLLASWAFETYAIDAIEFEIDPRNFASARVAIGAGARRTGESSMRKDNHGAEHRLERFELLPED
jgi:RimJ/RimL family protein N-acetyltransferase